MAGSAARDPHYEFMMRPKIEGKTTRDTIVSTALGPEANVAHAATAPFFVYQDPYGKWIEQDKFAPWFDWNSDDLVSQTFGRPSVQFFWGILLGSFDDTRAIARVYGKDGKGGIIGAIDARVAEAYQFMNEDIKHYKPHDPLREIKDEIEKIELQHKLDKLTKKKDKKKDKKYENLEEKLKEMDYDLKEIELKARQEEAKNPSYTIKVKKGDKVVQEIEVPKGYKGNLDLGDLMNSEGKAAAPGGAPAGAYDPRMFEELLRVLAAQPRHYGFGGAGRPIDLPQYKALVDRLEKLEEKQEEHEAYLAVLGGS